VLVNFQPDHISQLINVSICQHIFDVVLCAVFRHGGWCTNVAFSVNEHRKHNELAARLSCILTLFPIACFSYSTWKSALSLWNCIYMAALAVFTSTTGSHPFLERRVALTEPAKIGRSVAQAKPSPTNTIFDCKVLSRNHALLWYENGKVHSYVLIFIGFAQFVSCIRSQKCSVSVTDTDSSYTSAFQLNSRFCSCVELLNFWMLCLN